MLNEIGVIRKGNWGCLCWMREGYDVTGVYQGGKSRMSVVDERGECEGR